MTAVPALLGEFQCADVLELQPALFTSVERRLKGEAQDGHIDVTDAGIRSGGEPVTMLCTMDLVAWVRFGTVALKEANAILRAGTADAELANAFLDQECARLLRRCSR